MRRKERPRQPIVGHQRQARRLRLGQLRVCRNHADCRVLSRTRRGRLDTSAQYLACICQLSISVARARDYRAGGWIDDVTHGIDRYQRTDDEPVGQCDCRRTDPRLRCHAAAVDLADCGAGTRANITFGNRTTCRRSRGLVSAISSWTCFRGAYERQIEDDCGGNDRHDAGVCFVADVLLFQKFHDARSDVETKCAAAGEDNGVDTLHEVGRVEQIGFTCAGSAASLRDAADRTVAVGENDRASGEPTRQGEMTNADAGHLRDPLCGRPRTLTECIHREHQEGERTREHPRTVHRRGAGAGSVLVSQSVMAVVTSLLTFRSGSDAYSSGSPVIAGTRRWFTPRTVTTSTDFDLLSFRARSTNRSTCETGIRRESAAWSNSM